VARSVLRGCRDVVAGLLLTLSCALLLVLAARLDEAWLLVLGVRAYADPGLHGSKGRRALLDNFTQDRTVRPLSLLAC